jgi:hypothetical protein
MAGGLKVQDQPEVHSEFLASWAIIARSCLKKQNSNNKK